MIHAGDPAFENREVAFNGVGVNFAAYILADAMVDHAVVLEAAPQALGCRAFISHDESGFMHLGRDDGAQGSGGDSRNMVRPHFAATLDEREDGFLADSARTGVLALAAVFVLFQPAHERLVDFNGLALAAHRLR